jgi:hypothetical protein
VAIQGLGRSEMGQIRRREVLYVLELEDDLKTTRRPVAAYPRYIDALADGKELESAHRGWHRKITRHSLPFYPKAA